MNVLSIIGIVMLYLIIGFILLSGIIICFELVLKGYTEYKHRFLATIYFVSDDIGIFYTIICILLWPLTFIVSIILAILMSIAYGIDTLHEKASKHEGPIYNLKNKIRIEILQRKEK